MTQFTPYTGSPPDPNYLGWSKTPDPIKPNIAMGKLFEGIGDVIEMGIKGVDQIQKKSVEKEADQSFHAAQQDEIARLEGVHAQITGGAATPGSMMVQAPPPREAIPFGEEDKTPVGPFSRDGSMAEGRRAERTTVEDQGPLPPQAQRSLTYLQKVGQAGVNGKLSGTGVQMNGESIMSDLLQRYPGRSEQIRAIASKYGFGEGRYAAQLRTEINQWQQQISAKDTKDETWENQNRDVIIGTREAPGVDPNYFKTPKEVRRSQEYRDQLQERIGNYEAIKKNNDTEQSSINVRKARKEEIGDDQSRAWTNKINLEEGVSFRSLMDGLGFKGVTNTQDFLQKWREDPRNQDPKALQELGSKLQEYKTAKINKWTRDASNTYVGATDSDGRPIDPKTQTVLQVLKRDGLDKLHSEAMGHIDAIQKIIDTKGSQASFDWAGAAGRENQGNLDMRTRQVYKDYPVVLGTKVWENAVGPQVFGQMYQTEGSKIRQPIDDAGVAVINGTTSAIIRGDVDTKTKQPITISDTLHDYSHKWEINGRGGNVKPQDLAGLMDRVKTNILNPNLPKDYSIKFANYVFNDSTLFPQLKGTEKQKFLNQYASPEVSARIFSLGDAALTENYKRWLNNAVVSTTQETVSNYNAVLQRGTATGTTGTAFDSTPYFNLTYDPKTNKVIGNIADNRKVYEDVGQTPTRYGSIVNQLQTVRNSVEKINQTLGIIDPVLKQEKSTITPEMLSLFGAMGIKIKVDTKADGTPKPQPESTMSRFAAEDLPPSGNVGGDLGSFLNNPSGQLSTPVMAKGRGSKKQTSTNLSDNPIMGIQVDDIPEGMSARDFIKQLQSRP